MFANIYTKYNTTLGKGWTRPTTLHTKSGPEKNITICYMLTDYIDFKYFLRLLWRMLLETYDMDVFK